jgi:hypothetical protein
MTRLFAFLRPRISNKQNARRTAHRKARRSSKRHTHSISSSDLSDAEGGEYAASAIRQIREVEDDTIPLVNDRGVLREIEKRESSDASIPY